MPHQVFWLLWSQPRHHGTDFFPFEGPCISCSISSVLDEKVQEPDNDKCHPRWPHWTGGNPDAHLYLPELKGEENFDVWERRVLGTIRIQGLEGFVKGTETPPPSDTAEDILDLGVFEERRLCAFQIIFKSSEPIHSKLLLYGYRADQWPDDFDPQALWDAIHRWDLGEHLGPLGKVKSVRELSNIHHSQFNNLNELTGRANWLRRRLERASVPIAHELMKTYGISGLSGYPDENWVTSMYIESSDWSYSTLCQKIELKASWVSVWQSKAAAKSNKPQHPKRHRNARGRHPKHPRRGGGRQRVSFY
ncbi:hypothetical protein QBC32DRAFT_324782 [Pseudoneurospora amorphoporcata]|uniref:Uncharacterized protein n=1 Tax=Pseudoneurospora amorphoporcata TaxID=241081 RepID=A0AAN6NTW5_9PEZI|nr:hypothetical protein QBC32DRAFT_324782 [Pseudoneurospora amorphoporcata]